MSKGSWVGLIVFAILWTALIGLFDGLIARGLWRQARTANYAETTGMVTHSAVTSHRGSKGGVNYGVDIRYTYAVEGQTFEGRRYRHGAFNRSSDRKWADQAVATHAVGNPTTVFYDPRNPAEAVLHRGFLGSDVFVALFLLPFNAVMLGLWSVPAGMLWRRWRRPEAGGVVWQDDGLRFRVRLPRWSPWLAGLAATGLGAFLSIFIVGLSSGFRPGLGTAVGTLLTVLGLGLAAAWWTWREQNDGRMDLVVDRLARTVELPATHGRKSRRTLPADALSGVTVETLTRRGRKGRTTVTFAVHLHAQGRAEKLVEWMDEARANAFADWLRGQLPMGEPAAPPRKSLFPAEK
ncbi:MAG: DUF3592 domain-containing protein [Limisphaerales bacterium]